MLEAWEWQGVFGEAAAVAAFKQAVDVMPLAVVGVVAPPRGAAPMAVDLAGETTMFAVLTRPAAPITVPENLQAARPDLVARLVNA